VGGFEKIRLMSVLLFVLKVELFRCCLLGKKHCMNVWKDSTSSDSDSTQQLVQFFIILDGQGNVAGNDAALLVITGSITSKLKNLSTQVLENSGKVHWCTRPHSSSVFAIAQVASDTANRELETSLGGCRCRLFLTATTLSFSFARHDDEMLILDSRDERGVNLVASVGL
jgi:hypothetical protein